MMEQDVVAMEDYVAQDQRPLQKCLKDVASCDIYIGIFAWRYGYIPEKNNIKKLSITELEYLKAGKIHIPRLIFLLRDDVPWSPHFIDGTAQSDNKSKADINRLRNALKKNHLPSFFRDQGELTSLVVIAINNAMEKLKQRSTSKITSISRY